MAVCRQHRAWEDYTSNPIPTQFFEWNICCETVENSFMLDTKMKKRCRDGVTFAPIPCVACTLPSIYLVCAVFGTAIPTSSKGFVFILVNNNNVSLPPVPLSSLPMRLIYSSPRIPYIGRLEVQHNEEWGTVCSNLFGQEEADVACYGLNYTNGAVCYATRGFPSAYGGLPPPFVAP